MLAQRPCVSRLHRRRNACHIYCRRTTPSEEKQVGHSEAIMRTLMLALRATLPRWCSRPDRSAPGAPTGLRPVDAVYHTAASMDLESHLRPLCDSPLYSYGPVCGAVSPDPAAMTGGARAWGGRHVGNGSGVYGFRRVSCGTVVRTSITPLILIACSTVSRNKAIGEL